MAQRETRKDTDVELANNSCTCSTCVYRYAPWRKAAYERHGKTIPLESKLNRTCVVHDLNVLPSMPACREYINDGIPF